MKKTIYILTRLFNFNDRKTSLGLCNTINSWIQNGEIQGFDNCFLPYRDSNNKIINMENKTLEIFKLDCETIKSAVALVGYCDGPIYDSGIGFEIGYATTKNKPIILLTTDYFYLEIESAKYSISPLVNELATVLHVRENSKFEGSYAEGLGDIEKRLMNQLKDELKNIFPKKENRGAINDIVTNDIYLDDSLSRTEMNNEIKEEIINYLENNNISYYMANSTDIKNNLMYLRNSKRVLIFGDEFDFGIDSAIIQGLAFGWNKKTFLFSSTKEKYYQSNDFILYKNPMIEYSADIIKTKEELYRVLAQKNY